MKNLNPLLLLFLVVVLASCNIQVENDASSDTVTFEKSDITGRWIQTETTEYSEELQLSAFDLKDDFTAEIEIIDGSGQRTLAGSWQLHPAKKIGAATFKSDVSLTFYRDSAHKEVIGFALKEAGNKKILSGNEDEFEKN